jgi:DNA polymerase III delta prime subunit
MSDQESIPWVEKYRPTQFDTIVLDPLNRHIFQQILDKNYFPNLLFYGPPGTGKTTTIINLIQEYQTRYSRPNKSNIIHLNASDERGIDIIRNQIYSFVKSLNLFEPGIKFVVLDEVDYMTKNAQQALKYLLQTSSSNVRFCLICNYISKIDESLKNEFICIRFNQLPKSDIYHFIRDIAEKEGITISEKEINAIQMMYHSDIRSMINFLQLNQNFQIQSWNIQVMDSQIFDQLHEMFSRCCDPNTVEDTIKQIILFIYQTSVKHNTDSRHILYKYFNYIIRREDLYSEYLTKMEYVVHNTTAPIHDVLRYLCLSESSHSKE